MTDGAVLLGAGHCGITESGPSDCTSDSKGSWPLRSEHIGSIEACHRRCRQCERCNYVSVGSTGNDECAWYYRCPNLRTIGAGGDSYESWRLRNPPPRLSPPPPPPDEALRPRRVAGRAAAASRTAAAPWWAPSATDAAMRERRRSDPPRPRARPRDPALDQPLRRSRALRRRRRRRRSVGVGAASASIETVDREAKLLHARRRRPLRKRVGREATKSRRGARTAVAPSIEARGVAPHRVRRRRADRRRRVRRRRPAARTRTLHDGGEGRGRGEARRGEPRDGCSAARRNSPPRVPRWRATSCTGCSAAAICGATAASEQELLALGRGRRGGGGGGTGAPFAWHARRISRRSVRRLVSSGAPPHDRLRGVLPRRPS